MSGARSELREAWLAATSKAATSGARPLCAASDPFADVATSMDVYRGITGPVLVVAGPLGSVELSPDDVDALVRLARANGMVTT